MTTLTDTPVGVTTYLDDSVGKASYLTGTSMGQASYRIRTLSLPAVSGEEDYVRRVVDQPLAPEAFRELSGRARHLGVTTEFKKVIDFFAPPAGHTPPGFHIALNLEAGGLLQIDLVRDISYDADCALRPTNVLFSADSANPYEIAPVAGLLANLTCNPGIIYDLFLNNPNANVGGHFKDRDEVMTEIGRILGPGCDISVELNNPFETDFAKILEEAERFREMLSPWRVVIKVPHTGPVNADNVSQLLTGDKRLDRRWWQPSTEDAFRGHNLALKLHEHGFRVNFTLMFEPHQTQIALQARPYFINSFVRHRLLQSTRMQAMLDGYAATRDTSLLVSLREYMIATDYLASSDTDYDLEECRRMAEHFVSYRKVRTREGADGLDSVRHNLRALRTANLPNTRLIVCSMEGDQMYPEIDQLLTSDEFADMSSRVVVTAEPGYLARFTSSNQVVSYQRRFMGAAQGQN
ncbi:MAG: transaldolase family protein [Dermatophilaceae bacterium]